MARKRRPRPLPTLKTVTAERAARLYRLLKLLAGGPQTRGTLIRRLRLDIRGFYRDLVLLRDSGIDLTLANRRYGLAEDVGKAIARLPFPDPRLSLAEAVQLSRGRTQAHRKLKQQIAQIISTRQKAQGKRKK